MARLCKNADGKRCANPGRGGYCWLHQDQKPKIVIIIDEGQPQLPFPPFARTEGLRRIRQIRNDIFRKEV